MSTARVPITIKVRNKFEIKGELYRHIAPYTVRAMMKIGTFEGWAVLHEHGFMMLTSVRAGLEKSRRNFSAGDIAFLPINASIWFFARDANVDRPMSFIGRTEETEKLSDVKRGDYVTLVIEA